MLLCLGASISGGEFGWEPSLLCEDGLRGVSATPCIPLLPSISRANASCSDSSSTSSALAAARAAADKVNDQQKFMRNFKNGCIPPPNLA